LYNSNRFGDVVCRSERIFGPANGRFVAGYANRKIKSDEDEKDLANINLVESRLMIFSC